MCTSKFFSQEKQFLTLKKKWHERLEKRNRFPWLVSISLYFKFASCFQPCAFAWLVNTSTISCWASQEPCGLSSRVKSTLEARSYRKYTSVFFNESLAFLVNWYFFVKLCLTLVTDAHSCLIIRWVLYSSFPHLSLFLMQFLFILFSGINRLKTGKLGNDKKIKKIDLSREDEDKVKNST